MALLTFTFAQLQAAAQHASGVTAPAAGSTWVNVVNGALQRLANIKPWRWREADLSLDTIADQNYIALPDDFAELVTIHRASPWRDCAPVSLARIQMYRAANIGQDLGIIGYLYTIRSHAQATVTGSTTNRIELYPTPTLNETGALVGTYRRFIRAMSLDSDLPDIPPGPWHEALDALVRAMAASREDEQDGVHWMRFNEMLPDLIRADAGVETNLGYIDGGIEDRGPSDLYLYPRTISPA